MDYNDKPRRRKRRRHRRISTNETGSEDQNTQSEKIPKKTKRSKEKFVNDQLRLQLAKLLKNGSENNSRESAEPSDRGTTESG